MTAPPNLEMMRFDPSDRPRLVLLYVPAYDEHTEDVRATPVEMAMLSPIEQITRQERKQLTKAFEGCLKLIRDLRMHGHEKVGEMIDKGEIGERTYLDEES